jgi:hypothetical protein
MMMSSNMDSKLMEENSIQNFGKERCATVTGRNLYKI